MATERFTFPANFLWGTATAAHQVEGNNVNCDFWVLEHIPGSPFVEPSGDALEGNDRSCGRAPQWFFVDGNVRIRRVCDTKANYSVPKSRNESRVTKEEV